MSGIALVIPGANFSNSPLGSVTFKETNAEKATRIVNVYAESIGSHEFDIQLTQLAVDLMDIGVFDTLQIYPMLGDSVSKMMTNLNPSYTAVGNGIAVANNVTVGEAGLVFDTSVPSGVIGTDGYKVGSLYHYFEYCDFNGTPNTRNYRAVTQFIQTSGQSDGVRARLRFAPPRVYVGIDNTIGVTGEERHSFGGYVGDTTENIILDGAVVKTNDVAASQGNYPMYNYLGRGNETPSETTSFEGVIRLYVKGFIETNAKALQAAQILHSFVNTVKP